MEKDIENHYGALLSDPYVTWEWNSSKCLKTIYLKAYENSSTEIPVFHYVHQFPKMAKQAHPHRIRRSLHHQIKNLHFRRTYPTLLKTPNKEHRSWQTIIRLTNMWARLALLHTHNTRVWDLLGFVLKRTGPKNT